MIFNPYDWYWKADDGRLFSSRRQALIDESDADFQEWRNQAFPTVWPRDAEGNQTTASLQEVLSPYNLFADLVSYAANKRWVKETGGITFNGAPVATDDRSKQMIMGARIAAAADPNFVTPWVMDNGAIVELSAQAIVALSDAVLAHVQTCFAQFAQVQEGVAGGTIKTMKDVDAILAG